MSSTRKRMRLSSPTFDGQVGDLSQDDLSAFDSLDAQLSHKTDAEPDDTVPDASVSFAGFSAATSAMPGFQRPSINGQHPTSLFVPSAAALRDAEEKMRKWQDDDDLGSPHSAQVASPLRAFSSAKNAFASTRLLESPTSASAFGSAHIEPILHSGKPQPKPFKSPLIDPMPSIPCDHLPASQVATPVSPLRPSSIANHATLQKPPSFTPTRGTATKRPKFVTPFKAVSRPTFSRPFALENIELAPSPSAPTSLVNRIYPPSAPLSPLPSQQNSQSRFFDLSPPSGRRTLATSGLRPHTYSTNELEDMGISFNELGQINLLTAPFYTFTTRSRTPSYPPDPSSSLVLDRSVALEELHAKGCTLASQAWVDNHWSLVLWKLAGMVALDPMSEADPSKKRWCWPEVIRQLMYRYQRDLNSASRPPLRLITTRDASAQSPMVLCISDIIWPVSVSESDIIPAQPELEITDGWYTLRARIDAPITRGISKGKIKIGRKIVVAGAKLSAERKEGSEILEAYSSNVLLLTGNSTHMAPWHAKLGFQRGPFIATLNSLTPDGGNVAVMMLSVIKAYPVAYIEFIEDADGHRQREGPHDAKEELKLSTQWKTRRESHASRLWSEYEKRRYRLLDYAEHLEQRAGPKVRPNCDDGPPDEIYDIYDALLEEPDAFKNIASTIGCEDAGWLARHIRERGVQERDQAAKEIDQELETICPPRDVKAFCVIVVNDARTYKHPPKRTAQVTVWDVPGVSTPEGCTPNPFAPAQRYLVTNLTPSQTSAWMDRSPGSEIYLSTRKGSRWTLVN